MKIAALFSGGKDSTYALYWALKNGFEVAYLVSMESESDESYMYHVPNIHLTELLAEAIGIPLVKARTSGEKEREVEDLKGVLSKLDVEGVVAGALASRYQKERIDRIARELGIESFAPMWMADPEEYMRNLVREGFEVIIVGVSAFGLDESWLGRKIDEKTIDDLKRLNERYGVHMGGEGGEFETLVLDAPFFKKRLVIDEAEKVWEPMTGSGKLVVKRAHLEAKG